MYFFVLIVNPAARPSGTPIRKRQRSAGALPFSVKIIINLSFSGTIFYLFALSKALPLPYSYKGSENEKIAFASPTSITLAPLSLAGRNSIAWSAAYFLPTPSIGLNDKTLENNCVISNRKILPPHPHRPYETLRAIR
ncbi:MULTISPECIES: hypothetical protein [Serratia]|uniref:hypothetical protein n=1 Tax=Serratia TaxID=613 RepID=UPI0011151CB9|nr:hypothetical protein [Serratia marcescens]MBH2669421.1 hypothetical protein [Serratia marcescens]MBH2674508.1 hypothetical protein [Serratia marcescens]MBN5394768.1 hypothetical protein [Serratia marcescens]QPJ89454.1 hypothetical protein HS042_14460 [Serratia marcescens]HAT3736376.1 hypothetical protein [Serratia marcescens]